MKNGQERGYSPLAAKNGIETPEQRKSKHLT
jgi:hypothetical protein